MARADIGAARRQLLMIVNAQGERIGGSAELYLPARWAQAVAGNALLYLAGAETMAPEIEQAVDDCIKQLKLNLARLRQRSFEGAPES